MKKIKTGIIGCGNISNIYLEKTKEFESLELTACADMLPERAKAKAEEHGIRAMTVEEMLADPEIGIVINLTIPKAHHPVALAALQAGKSVYNEKPLTLTRAEGRELLETAKAKKQLVGCAPDTFLGGGHQTCRKLIDDGWIGTPVSATAFMVCHGHESWHPDPEFYYKAGGGPMFDMGPYYLTALVNMVGPVKKIAGMTRKTFNERTITSKPKYGQKVTVDVPTHVAGLLEFANGAIGTIITSFDVWGYGVLPWIEVNGTEGSLFVPDPNGFGGTIKLRRAGYKEWREIPLTHIYAENTRGLGVADMAVALQTGRKHRASGELAYHVLDIMHGIHDAANEGRTLALESTCERPAALPLGLLNGMLDA